MDSLRYGMEKKVTPKRRSFHTLPNLHEEDAEGARLADSDPQS